MRAAASTMVASVALFGGVACGGDDTPDREANEQPAERGDPTDQRKPARAAPSGRRLFVENCGNCHTLADAGATGTVGPDLDEHFGPHHKPHVGEIRETIRKGPGRMPANRVRGLDARAVAKYVAGATRK